MIRRIKSYKFKDRLLQAKEKSIGFILIIFLLFSVILLFYLQVSNFYSRVYKGKVIDKRFSVLETDQGSKMAGKVIIEKENGEKIKIVVDSEKYHELQIGDYIENKGNGVIVLSVH